MANENKNQLIVSMVTAVVAFVTYLLMRRYVLSDKITREDYIIAGAIAVALVVANVISERRKKRKNQ